MATVGTKGTRFTCQLKMEEQIHCAHTVVLTAPGLTIDKAGVVGQSLTYSFSANDGLTAQDIGIVGNNPGEFKIFADITSPYFVTASGLKVKKDSIGITINDAPPSGLYGTYAGVKVGVTLADLFDCNLYITHQSQGAGETLVGRCANVDDFDGSFTAVIIKPDGSKTIKSHSSFDASISCTQVGAYTIEFYDVQYIGTNTPLKSKTFSYVVNGGVQASRNIKHRGVQYYSIVYAVYPLNDSWTSNIVLLDSNQPYGSVSVSNIVVVPSPAYGTSFSATISFSAGTVSGKWLINTDGQASVTFSGSPTSFGGSITVRQLP